MNMDKNFKDMLRQPGYKVNPGEKPPIGVRDKHIVFRVGMVESVNVDHQTVNIKLFNNQGYKYNCGITQPFAGAGSYIAGMPEVGSIVIFGEDEDNCFIISYYPNYYAGLEAHHLKRWPDNIRNTGQNDLIYKFRKLRPGEVAFSSGESSEIFLNDNIVIENSLGDNLLFRSDDHSVISTSLNNYVFSSGIWKNAGIIYRNSLGKSNKNEGEFAVREPLKNGKATFPLRPEGTGDFSKYYTEYLIEAEDEGYTSLPINDVNSDRNASTRNPISVFALGNFVGNNQSKIATYGRILGVKLFNSADDEDGNFRLEPLSGRDADIIGMAISLYKPERRNYERGAYFGIDKEGHFYQFIPSASGGGIGKGRSMSIVAQGNKKEIWGSDSATGNAWDLVLKGGLKWRVGSHDRRDPDLRGRSLDIRTNSTAFFIFGEGMGSNIKDFKNETSDINLDSYRKVERIAGNERHETRGNRESIIGGSEKLKIDGMREEKIVGSMSLAVGTGMNVTVGDTYAVKVTKEKQESFGSRRTTITGGSSELIMDPKPNPAAIGNITERIKIKGNKETTIGTGDITENIRIKGNRKFKTTTGNFDANIATKGNITLKTNIGKIILDTKTGEIQIKGSKKISIKTSAGVEIKGSKIDLKGEGLLLSGVITNKSHSDYITGAPLQPSRTVKATL